MITEEENQNVTDEDDDEIDEMNTNHQDVRDEIRDNLVNSIGVVDCASSPLQIRRMRRRRRHSSTNQVIQL